MNIHKLNKVFESVEAENNWIEENCPNMTYQGDPILMVNSYEDGDTVILKEIWTV